MAVLTEEQNGKLKNLFSRPDLSLEQRQELHRKMAEKGYSNTDISSVDPSYAMGDVPLVGFPDGKRDSYPPTAIAEREALTPSQSQWPSSSVDKPEKSPVGEFAAGLTPISGFVSGGIESLTGSPGALRSEEPSPAEMTAERVGYGVGSVAQLYGGWKMVSGGYRALRAGNVLKNLRRASAEAMDAFRDYRNIPVVVGRTVSGKKPALQDPVEYLGRRRKYFVKPAVEGETRPQVVLDAIKTAKKRLGK